MLYGIQCLQFFYCYFSLFIRLNFVVIYIFTTSDICIVLSWCIFSNISISNYSFSKQNQKKGKGCEAKGTVLRKRMWRNQRLFFCVFFLLIFESVFFTNNFGFIIEILKFLLTILIFWLKILVFSLEISIFLFQTLVFLLKIVIFVIEHSNL